MSPTKTLAIFIFFCCVISFSFASDPDSLQDLCVALPSSGVKVNGFACKPEANVTESDFFFDGLAKPAHVNNTFGYGVSTAFVDQVPGLNTLGLSFARADYRPGGVLPPHTHPRANELVFVLDGQLNVGFITTSNKVISKTIKKGDIFAFPKGLLHFQKNNEDKPASIVALFDSQLPGFYQAQNIFTTTVPDNVLAQTFQIDISEVHKIKTNLAPKKI